MSGGFKPYVNVDRCKGCGICVDVCPVKIFKISISPNSRGYYYTTVIGSGCVGCRLCEYMCPDFAVYVVEDNL